MSIREKLKIPQSGMLKNKATQTPNQVYSDKIISSTRSDPCNNKQNQVVLVPFFS